MQGTIYCINKHYQAFTNSMLKMFIFKTLRHSKKHMIIVRSLCKSHANILFLFRFAQTTLKQTQEKSTKNISNKVRTGS